MACTSLTDRFVGTWIEACPVIAAARKSELTSAPTYCRTGKPHVQSWPKLLSFRKRPHCSKGFGALLEAGLDDRRGVCNPGCFARLRELASLAPVFDISHGTRSQHSTASKPRTLPLLCNAGSAGSGSPGSWSTSFQSARHIDDDDEPRMTKFESFSLSQSRVRRNSPINLSGHSARTGSFWLPGPS